MMGKFIQLIRWTAVIIQLISTVSCGGYPVILASYKEIPSTVEQIKLLSEQPSRNSSPLQYNIVSDVIVDWLTSCPADTFLIVNQPGLEPHDFILQKDDIIEWDSFDHTKPRRWHQLRKILKRVGTLGIFPRVSDPIDLNQLKKLLNKQCSAELLTADVKLETNPIKQYVDTKRRAIQINFDLLPEDPKLRKEALISNDETLDRILRATPSPFYAIIYTSDSPWIKDNENEKLNIFQDITDSKKDPRNRKQWRRHELRPNAEPSNQYFSRRPPLHMQKKEEERQSERKSQPQSGESNILFLDQFLTVQTVILIVLIMSFLLVAFLVLKWALSLLWISKDIKKD